MGVGVEGLSPGDRLDGRYELLRVVGSGGMGHVFAARRLALGDLVAIKCLHHDRLNHESRARFLREARAMARIRHPNVVQVFDFGDPPDAAPYLVMELLDGPTLASVLQRHGRLPVERVVALFADLCAAVEAGHRRGVVHRDLKPGNVLLARDDDGGETLKVLDFGLARLVGDAQGTDELETKAGVLMGTSAYMSPEQIETGEAGTASDVFALGVLLYELATGALPFRGANAVATIMRITSGEYTPPRSLVPELPDALAEAIAASLVRDPAARPGSPQDLARMLDIDGVASSSRIGAITFSTSASIETATRNEPSTMDDVRGRSDEHTQPHTQAPATKDRASVPAIHGRALELEALGDALSAAVSGRRPRVSLVTGEPGMGKSALCEHYGVHAESQGAKVFRGRFYSYEGDRPPPNEAFLWMLGDEDSRGGKNLHGAQPRRDDDASFDPADKWRAFEHIGREFIRRGAGRPLVLVFDDIQWATRLELDCVSYLLRAMDGHPVHLLLTARTNAVRPDSQTEASRWLTQMAHQSPGLLGRVPLGSLSSSTLQRWLESTHPGLRAQPLQVRRLHRACGGNPHYFAELVRQLEAQRALRRDERGWVLDAPPDLAMPESVAHAVLANLASLSDEARRVAEVASVVGEQLRFETLQAATGLGEQELEDILERGEMKSALTERGTSAGSDYRFVSPTIRGVLYDAMSRRRRRRAHRSVVDALERLYSGDPKRIAKVLCYHYDAVEDWPRALETGLAAAEATTASFDADNAELALRRVQRAIQALEDDGEPIDTRVRARAAAIQGTLAVRLGRYDEAEHALRRADSLTARAGDMTSRVDILLQLAECELGRGSIEESARRCAQALQLAEDLLVGHRQLCWRARVAGAAKFARLGRYRDAEALLAEILEAVGDDLPELRARAHREQAWMDARRGRLESAETHAARCEHIARTHRDPYSSYLACSVSAIIAASRGNAEIALERYERAIEAARALSLRRREMIETANSAMAHLQIGNVDEALRRMLQTRALCRELGDRASEGDSLVGTGRVLVARGELDEAAASLERGRKLCAETGRTEYAALASLELGLIRVEQEDTESAIDLLETARHEFEATGSVFLWRVYEGLARVLAKDPETAEQSREHADKALSQLDVLLADEVGSERDRERMREARASLRRLAH